MDGHYLSRVSEIAKKKGSDKVFGATTKFGHGFVLTPHSQTEILFLESHLDVRLPEQYAQFLMDIGSGAGPYYGLFSPSKIMTEVAALNGSLKDRSRLPSRNAPFPFRQSDASAIRTRLDGHDSAPYASAPWLCDGCVPICAQGCTGYNGLVTAGELRGTVWDVNDDGAVAQWLPARRPIGVLVPEWRPRPLPDLPSPPTFLQWYESWLERVETDLLDHRTFDSRNHPSANGRQA